MAAHLTDKQKKRIIADRADGLSQRQLAAKYHVSDTTIRRTLKNDPETTQKVAQKKEQNTVDILEYMDTKKNKVKQVIDRYLDALLEEEKIDQATLSQLTTALGTLIDKWTAQNRGSVINTTLEDDPITSALKEEAQHGLLG